MHKPKQRATASPSLAAARPGKPVPVSPDPHASPRLPHERDESVDSHEQAAHDPTQREVGQAAHDDVERGAVDTDRGPVTERTYQRLKRPER